MRAAVEVHRIQPAQGQLAARGVLVVAGQVLISLPQLHPAQLILAEEGAGKEKPLLLLAQVAPVLSSSATLARSAVLAAQ
jgi:hypothetical protein